jgi:hypothetical protein
MDLMQRATNSEGRMRDERNQFAYSILIIKLWCGFKLKQWEKSREGK